MTALARVARVALVNCEDAPKWRDHLQIWSDALAAPEPGRRSGRADDGRVADGTADAAGTEAGRLEWRHYSVCAGELPTVRPLPRLESQGCI